MPNTLSFDHIKVDNLQGDIKLEGSISSSGALNAAADSTFDKSLSIGKDLSVAGEIRAITIRADNLIAKVTNELKDPLVFSHDKGGVLGKGMIFKRDENNFDLFIYRADPNRIFSNLDLELHRENVYRIDGISVLTHDTLGNSIVNSNLKKIGNLVDLKVTGSVSFGDQIFYNNKSDRFGIGTDAPNAALGVVENGVELTIGSLSENTGNIGTFTAHDLGIVTDSVTRINISRNGKIEIGSSAANNADVSIYGKLYVKELIVDQRSERTAPLEFKALPGSSNYGKGMIFTGQDNPKQFLFSKDPEAFKSSENINLAKDKGYFIDGRYVVSADSLGPTVKKSSLTELGELTYLSVSGEVHFGNTFSIKDDTVFLGDLKVTNKQNGVNFRGSSFCFSTDMQSITINNDSIVLGNKNSPVINTIINGTLAVGMQTVGENAQIDVAGNIRFSNRLFAVGNQIPTVGTFRKGDIVWNDNPQETGYVGWVCIREGTPGIWRKFGQIGHD